MKVFIVMGTRPEVIKNYSIVKALKDRGHQAVVVHTNQHYDYDMNKVFFEQLGYSPTYLLSGKYKIGKAIDWVMDLIRKENPDFLIVNGDTAASLVGSIAGMYTDTRVCHVEAGLRSFDLFMYEERNRMMDDIIANYLFTYAQYQADFLKTVIGLRGKIYNVGNTTVDVINDFKDKIKKPKENGYFYMTMHRKEFTDYKERIISVFNAVNRATMAFKKQCIFPIHPRTLGVANEFGIDFKKIFNPLVKVIDPVPVFTSLSYEKYADLIITDSGCIQEEACIFRTPCVTVRENTERPETIEAGCNIITGFKEKNIYKAIDTMLHKEMSNYKIPYGKYGVGKRIVRILEKQCQK